MNCLRALAVALVAACGCGPEAASPPVVAAAPIEAQPAPRDLRAELEAAEAKGFVLVPSEGVKWPTPEAARAGEGGSSGATNETSGGVTVHRVVRDLGDVVEVLPIDRDDGAHCHTDDYASVARLKVRGFVSKRDLAVVLADHAVVEVPAETGYEVRAGAWVVGLGDERVARVEGLELPLPPSAELALSYPARDDRRFAPRAPHFDWRGRDPGPEPTFVLPEAVLRVGDHVFAGSAVADHPGLSAAREVTGEGERRTVTLASGCLSLRATVAAEHLREGYERGGGVAMIGRGGGGMGYGRLGGGGGRPPPPPPKEHYAPEGTPLFWKGTDVPAGELTAAILSYPIDAPVCVRVEQGFVGDPEVCYAASAVVRDCRSACDRDGLCAVSGDGARCVANSAEHCKASQECEYHGACRLRGERCEAASDEDCKHSLYCEVEPHACMAHEGKCVVTPNPDCANRPACKKKGRCVAGELGQCVAGEASDCASSDDCARLGNCESHGDSCAPRKSEHCRQSGLGKGDGRCALQGTRCVVSSARDCEHSASCTERGACALAYETETGFGGMMGDAEPSRVAYCAPNDDDDCRGASECRGGECRVEATWGRRRCVFD